MHKYVVLIRGINVGGKNLIPMVKLKACLEDLGFADVKTYIASGNVLLRSSKPAKTTKAQIEKALVKNFKTSDKVIRVLVLSPKELRRVLDKKPAGFGEQPKKYHSDVIFLIDIKLKAALAIFNPREGVDTIAPGPGIVYSERLSAKRTQSRLSKIVAHPLYKYMTIRNWNTVKKLSELLEDF